MALSRIVKVIALDDSPGADVAFVLTLDISRTNSNKKSSMLADVGLLLAGGQFETELLQYIITIIIKIYSTFI